MKAQIDVVVVGAGPVGLLMAIELKLAGVGVLVLERLAAPSTVLKAGGIGPLGIEALQRRGMATALAAAQEQTFGAPAQDHGRSGGAVLGRRSKYSGHFAGLMLIRADAQAEPHRRGAPVAQQDIEAMLSDRVRALGIEVRRSCEVAGLAQSADGIDVTWVTSSGDDQIRCAYLIGCDGGRSAVRKMAGFAFPGSDPTLTMYQALTEIDHPEQLASRGFARTSGGMYSYGFSPNRLIMADFGGPPKDRQAPITHRELEDALRRISRQDVRIKAFENASRWTDHARLVETYRHGRVLLAGDAAHVHSPFGGQGLSLGLVDAANLGWKLAAVIRGTMPEPLLDTYTAERRPVAEGVLANTRAQIAIMRPDPQSEAMRAIMADLLQFDEVNRFMGAMTNGLAVRYDLGSQLDAVGRLIGDQPIRQGDAETTLYDLMQNGTGVLLDATDGAATRLVTAHAKRIRCVAVAEGPSMLIRPDACLAWISEAGRPDGLMEALGRWFAPDLMAEAKAG